MQSESNNLPLNQLSRPGYNTSLLGTGPWGLEYEEYLYVSGWDEDTPWRRDNDAIQEPGLFLIVHVISPKKNRL